MAADGNPDKVEQIVSSVRYAAFRSVRLVGTTLGLLNLGVAAISYKLASTVTPGLRLIAIGQLVVILSCWLFTEKTHRIGAALHVTFVGALAVVTLHALGFTVGTCGLFIWLGVVAGIFYGRTGGITATAFTAVMLGAFLFRGAPDSPPYGSVFAPLDLSLRWSAGILTISAILTAAVVAVCGRLETAARELTEAVARESRTLENLARTRQLEVAGRLVGGVAHEINNMLTPVMVWGSLLQQDHGQEKDIAEAAENIMTSARSAAVLMKQLMSFSAPGTSPKSTVDVHHVLEACSALLKSSIGKNISLEVSLGAGRSTVHGDFVQLQNALVNLALNALDAMQNGGTLTLSTRNEADELEVQVRDTGIGMSIEQQARLFEPLFTTKPERVGLGLATVHATAVSHGAQISVESAEGRGSTFRLTFPTVVPVEEPKPKAAPIEARGRVLVVDDEELVRKGIVRLLSRRGFDCCEAGDGAAALALYNLDREAIRLVVMDSEMPTMTGRQLLEAVRVHSRQLPVLFVTGFVKDVDVDALGKDARLRVLAKPFDPEKVVELVNELLA